MDAFKRVGSHDAERHKPLGGPSNIFPVRLDDSPVPTGCLANYQTKKEKKKQTKLKLGGEILSAWSKTDEIAIRVK